MMSHLNTQCNSRSNRASLTSNDYNPEGAVRRTANYKPSLWDYDFLQSLKSEYTEEKYTDRAEKLKEDVRLMFEESHGSPLPLLKLVDTIQKLGIDYHFYDEIKVGLDTIVSTKDMEIHEDLYTIALRFRLLRQHGRKVSQDFFQSIVEILSRCDLKQQKLENDDDVMGMLSLYEASFFAFEGEDILDEAQQFTVRQLSEYIRTTNPPSMISKQVRYALELPLHWRAPRYMTSWFLLSINAHTSAAQQMDPLLFEFAKLDFNMVQATCQRELVYVARWWKELDLTTVCHFARNRLVESFMAQVGFYHEPKFGSCRQKCAQLCQFVCTIDDIYDVYGYLDELKPFTEAVERWDINRVEHLPHYMKICFFALYNTINEMAYEVLKKHGLDVIHYMKKAWSDLCKAYLVEAEWYNNGYTPTLEEYLENGWISVAVPMIKIHVYFLLDDYHISKEALDCLKDGYPDIVRWTSLIVRLVDDLATSTDELKRGDVPKSIQCYMKHAGVSEYNARKHINHLISETWKKINTNESKALSIFPMSYINAIKNITRTCQCFYKPGDGVGIPDTHVKSWILSMIVEPIHLSHT